MFTTKDKLNKKGGFEERYNYLKQLQDEFKNSKSKEAKHQVIANLANFAYDPINYELFKRLRIVDLFLEQLSSSDQDYLEYAVAGLANISADSEFAEYLITHNVINILLPYLDHQDEEIIMNVLILLIQLITPETSHLVLTPETISKVFALQFQDQRIKNLKTIFLEDYCTAEQLKLLSS